jgi:hypothetical protein
MLALRLAMKAVAPTDTMASRITIRAIFIVIRMFWILAKPGI